MNDIPYVFPNFLPYNPNNNNDFNNDIKRSLDKILHEVEQIEKRLTIIENNMNIKQDNYLSSNVDSGKGLYMI